MAPVQPQAMAANLLDLSSWANSEPVFERLLNWPIHSLEDLKAWLVELSEVEAEMSEETGWRYIRMTCNTTDVAAREAFNFIVSEIEPKVAIYLDKFNHKLVNCPFVNEIGDPAFSVMLRKVRRGIELFRDENIDLSTQITTRQQEFGAISSALSITQNGKSITLQQAQLLLKENDREFRKSVYLDIKAARASVSDKLDQLFTDLIELRTKLAQNAGFSNFRDYQHSALSRFDYSVNDVLNFHQAIRTECTPLVLAADQRKKKALALSELKPWDLDVDPEGRGALRPFETADELLSRTIDCFTDIRPYYGKCLRTMADMGRLDLASRIGKAPGGYQYPLYRSGVPFIFMNAVGTVRDLITMVHEGGHALHSFLSRDLELTAYKSLPSEVAELASMSMELLSFDHWHHFFVDPNDARRAKREHLEKVISVLPWVAIIDKFQHWAYTHPGHSLDERAKAWVEIHSEFGSNVVDWSGLETERSTLWQRQMHIFEVPFYYIEYAMAQLGAIAIWRNYRLDPEGTLNRYEAALALGYTRPIGEIYATAGIRFDFSQEYVSGLMAFVNEQYEALA